MQVYNPYTRQYIDYPIDLDLWSLTYHIRHETPFIDRYSEWSVTVLNSGDEIYIPSGSNPCNNIYIVTKFYLKKLITLPHGIYTIPIGYFTCRRNNYE